jgi:hypothetical protein
MFHQRSHLAKILVHLLGVTTGGYPQGAPLQITCRGAPVLSRRKARRLSGGRSYPAGHPPLALAKPAVGTASALADTRIEFSTQTGAAHSGYFSKAMEKRQEKPAVSPEARLRQRVASAELRNANRCSLFTVLIR